MRHVRTRFGGAASAAAVSLCALLLMTLALCPLVSPRLAEAAPAAKASAGSSAAVGVMARSKTTAGGLDKAKRKVLARRFTQAIESMRTVQSARVVKAGSLKIRASKKNQKRIARLLGDIVNFHPEYFYVSTSLTLERGPDGCYRSFELGYAYKFSSLKKQLAKCEKGLEQLLSWVPEDASDLQKAKAVHDWLVRNCIYDANVDHERDRVSPYSICGALAKPEKGQFRKVVCQGYALTYQLAMDQLGIESTCVGQYIGDEGHMWNRVKIDGSWYNVDVTFDDPYAGLPYSYRDGGFYAAPSTRYFMKSDAWWKKHAARGGWHASWYPRGKAGKSRAYDSTKKWETYLRAAKDPSKPTAPIVAFGDYARGTRLEGGGGSTAAVYQVTGRGTVTYRGCAVSRGSRTAKVPAAVKLGKRSFAVTGIARGAFSARPGVRTVTVSAKGISARSARGCLVGSRVRTVNVPASRKSAYKKCLAKSNSGRSVRVR